MLNIKIGIFGGGIQIWNLKLFSHTLITRITHIYALKRALRGLKFINTIFSKKFSFLVPKYKIILLIHKHSRTR